MKYSLTIPLLKEFTKAALRNAHELCDEAQLLVTNGHFARAYFLAVAAIEETGKAQIAFDAQGRKINDTAIASRVAWQFEDHSSKINSAFIPWINASSDKRKAATTAIDLMVDLIQAREPSMYTDIKMGGQGVHIPNDVVRPVAAKDCVRLARDCLAQAKRIMESGVEPTKSTPNRDALYSMKPGKFGEILKTEDYWWYYLDRMEKGDSNFEKAVIDYRQEYMANNRTFKSEDK